MFLPFVYRNTAISCPSFLLFIFNVEDVVLVPGESEEGFNLPKGIDRHAPNPVVAGDPYILVSNICGAIVAQNETIPCRSGHLPISLRTIRQCTVTQFGKQFKFGELRRRLRHLCGGNVVQREL